MDGVSERNKQKVRLFVELVCNQGRLELIDDLIADDYVGRFPCLAVGVLGPQGVRSLVSDRRMPDLCVRIVDQIAEDDRVATRWRATTKAAAGRAPCYDGISITRFLAGKQVDSHTEFTRLEQPAGRRPTRPSCGRGVRA
jgi:hypothetical protein